MKSPALGELRDYVLLFDKTQSNDPDSTGLITNLNDPRLVPAKIEPVSTYLWLASVGVSPNDITHKITMLWRDDIEHYDEVHRQRNRPDGSTRLERYQVQRMCEDGNQVFIELDVTLLQDQ